MTDEILVFGEGGQVARAIAGLRDRSERPLIFAGRSRCDLLNDDPAGLVETVRPAAVINAAAYTAVDKAETEVEAAMRLNRDAPALMARACGDLDIPFVHISTDYVFDGELDRPYTEDDAPNPLGVYGRSKLDGERAIASVSGSWTIFRASWVISPQGSNFVNTMKRLASERDVVRVVDDQSGRPTLADDIATMCLDAVERGRREDRALQGLFHLAGADDATWADMAEHVFAHLARSSGRRPRLERIATAEYPTPARRPMNSRLDTSKLQAAVNWRPRAWRQAVDHCLG